jgi:hypothetical protein
VLNDPIDLILPSLPDRRDPHLSASDETSILASFHSKKQLIEKTRKKNLTVRPILRCFDGERLPLLLPSRCYGVDALPHARARLRRTAAALGTIG